LTLETGAFLAEDFLAACFGAALRALVETFALPFTERAFAGLRAGALAVTARFAFALAGAFALTARFPLFADADLAFEREVDRLNPFVRLLLMG
jgi:hypothetical protein